MLDETVKRWINEIQKGRKNEGVISGSTKTYSH
jgi:hypothetical protein